MLTSHWWTTPTSSETSLTHHIAGKMAVVQTFCDWVDVPIPPLKVFLPWYRRWHVQALVSSIIGSPHYNQLNKILEDLCVIFNFSSFKKKVDRLLMLDAVNMKHCVHYQCYYFHIVWANVKHTKTLKKVSSIVRVEFLGILDGIGTAKTSHGPALFRVTSVVILGTSLSNILILICKQYIVINVYSKRSQEIW